MKKNLLFFLALCLWTSSHVVSPAAADTLHDPAVWMAIFYNGKVDENWIYGLELHNRMQADSVAARGNRFQFRWTVSRVLSPEFRVGVGHVYTPNFSPHRNENRIFEQFIWTPIHADWNLSLRTRIEQRWIERVSDVAHRIRESVRLQYLPAEATLGAALWDEVMFNLNSLSGGPQTGLDHNRVFLGPLIRFGPQVRMELGYLNALTKSFTSTVPDLMTHALWVSVVLD